MAYQIKSFRFRTDLYNNLQLLAAVRHVPMKTLMDDILGHYFEHQTTDQERAAIAAAAAVSAANGQNQGGD